MEAELYWENKELCDLPGEIWVDAYGYDGLYSVSNLGRVKSEERRVPTFRGDRRVRARILSQAKSKPGRLSVNLCQNNKAKPTPVNQLVYYSFNPDKINDGENNEVYHKNKIEHDNRLKNLCFNNIKGKSYKISIDLGNVTHLETARKKHQRYAKENAIFKDGRTTHRKCKVCEEMKKQSEFHSYGRNTCKDCRNAQRRRLYYEAKT